MNIPSSLLEFRQRLRVRVAVLGTMTCTLIITLNLYEAYAINSVYKLGTGMSNMLIFVLFACTLSVNKTRDLMASVMLLSTGPVAMLSMFIFEVPELTMPSVIGLIGALLFAPRVIHPGLIRSSQWALGLLACYATGLAVRVHFRGMDLADSLPELIVLICGPLTLTAILWVLVLSVFRRLESAVEESEQLRAAVSLQNDQLREVSQVKSRFLANMSHELRTPLNAIIGYSEMITEEIDDDPNSNPHWGEDLQKVQRSGRHLLSLISDVLDLSKIESGHMVLELREISLAQLCQGIVETCEPLMAEHRNTLVSELDVAQDIFMTDSTKLSQILLNLLSNAAKFTKEGTVTLKVTEQTPGRVVFSVQDTGIGIPQEMHERLFEPFEQADASTTREHGGTGLGLALVKDLSQLLQGDVTLESSPGEGARFDISLPRLAADAML